MADEDPALFVTWQDELRLRDEREAKRAEWTTEHELVGMVGQLTSLHRNEFLIYAGVKQRDLPEVWRPRRPGQPDPNAPRTVTPGELAHMMRGG